MLIPFASEVLMQDRHAELRASVGRRRTARRASQQAAVRVWLGWMLVRASWRLAASGRRASVTILGRTTL